MQKVIPNMIKKTYSCASEPKLKKLYSRQYHGIEQVQD